MHFRPRHFPRKTLMPALLVSGLLSTCGAAQAYDIRTNPYLLGDWGGLRTDLAERGITLNLGYTGEAAHNFSGGQEKLTRYTDQWVIGSTMDLDKLVGWRGGTFQMTITDRNGRNLGADAGIGNNMLIQEVYGRGQTWHMTQFWLNQSFLGGRVQWKIGRLTVGEDFANFSCAFQNLTFCGSQPGNLVGSYWVNWPTSQWATRLKINTSEQTYVQAGIYQVNPNYVNDDYARSHGLSLDNPSGTTGALVPLEFGWRPDWNGLPGSYKFGVWYNTSNGKDLYQDVNHAPRGETGLAPRERNGQYGVYINFEQQVSGTAGGRGASVFLNISQADRETAAQDHQIALGLQYKGPFARARDVIGVALGATHNNGRYARYVRQQDQRLGTNTKVGDGYEYVAEVYYSWSPMPSIYLRPNLQYIRHPGGTSANHDAFIVGLKTGITF
ncbi:porin [Pandoraea pulmonicola]|uniref:Porin n=1 Tax=Pandoraea pulmonicola TaxID=93221 RepID=A0ABM5S708_PANPU|nr:porin [Pandoraea pulmonicola]